MAQVGVGGLSGSSHVLAPQVTTKPKTDVSDAPHIGQVGQHSVQQVMTPSIAKASVEQFIPHLGTGQSDGGWMKVRAGVFADDHYPGLRDAVKHLGTDGWLKVVGQYQQELRDTVGLMASDPDFAKLGHADLQKIAQDVLANVLLRHRQDAPTVKTGSGQGQQQVGQG
jgi:hypothetical protein